MKKKFKDFIFLQLVVPILLIAFGFKVNAAYDNVNTIPVCYATDNNYVYPTLVSITSILENARESTHYNIYILSGGVDQYNREKISSLNEHYKNHNIILVDMDNSYSGSETRSWSTAMYYRLKLASILPDVKKCIYLDGDTIINKDLSELYNLDMSNYYMAGSSDSRRQCHSYAAQIGIPSIDQYICSGVLLMNLEKIRNDNLEPKFDQFIDVKVNREKVAWFPDQDAINAVCYGRILELSVNHVLIPDLENSPFGKADPWSTKEQAYRDPNIIHYAGPKPWNCRSMRFAGNWERYRRIADDMLYKTIPEGVYTIHSALDNNMVIDICEGGKNNKDNVWLYRLNYSKAQMFRISYTGKGYYQIEALCSGKVLDVAEASKKRGANVWQYSKNNSDAQKWLIRNVGNGCYTIESKCNGLLLDVLAANASNGNNIQVFHRNGSDAQKFRFIAR